MTTIAPTLASDLRAGDRVYKPATGQFRTIAKVTRVPGKAAIKITFRSKTSIVVALDARFPVAR